jgi:NADH-quinone oxidoreductase subunit F
LDLHLTPNQPTTEERQAVDGVLGAPESGWSGGERQIKLEGHSAFGGHAARADRHLLLPVLQGIQSRVGWISAGALNYACQRLNVPPADAFGVADFYALLSVSPRPPVVMHVCDDIACATRGADELCRALEEAVGPPGSPGSLGRTTWERSPCLGQCEKAPAALLIAAGPQPYQNVLAPTDLEGIQAGLSEDRETAENCSSQPSVKASIPQAGEPELRLLRRMGLIDPNSLDDYKVNDGYQALEKALTLGWERVIQEVVDSKLLGRGGAAFPAGVKWKAVAAAPQPRYLICNADESEPGTFKDRLLMEEDPFSVVEATTIAGLATGCQQGYVYLRGEYPVARRRLANCIEAARAAGLLGKNILDSGLDFDLEIRIGAGAYICGEETALFNSIEGFRGEPRNKPPYPSEFGLFGQPTVVNNVETLVNVLEIVLHGGGAYASKGTEQSTGTKLFCLSGHIARPGVYEVPFGKTLRQLIDLAGGVSGSGRLQAVLLGGAAGSFLAPQELDTPLTFEATRSIGASLGSAVVMLFDDTVDLRKILLRIAAFFRDESCGQCVPCRVGSVRQEELLHRLMQNQRLGSMEEELSLLREIGQVMRDASICGLGQTASSAIESALARWNTFNGGVAS